MKIKINEYAEYNIKIKDSLDQQEFFQFLDTLNQIAKMIKKDFLVDSDDMIQEDKKESPKIKSATPKKLHKREYLDTKEKAIKILKLHYFGNKEKKNKFAEDNNTEWVTIVKGIHGLKNRYSILPKEIGLKSYPTKTGLGELDEIEKLKL